MKEHDDEVRTVNDRSALNWKHLKDQKLYNDNDYAIEILKQGIDLSADGFDDDYLTEANIVYHCYWFGVLGRKQIFSIKSLLCTQDMAKCKVILWLDVNSGSQHYLNNTLLKEIARFVQIKFYDPVIEVMGTPWENNVEIPANLSDLVERADAFRFLILYKYGGVYFDLDIMFLKDIRPLLNREFCYAWEKQSYANSAVLNLTARSDISTYLLKKAIQIKVASPWKIFIYDDLLLKGLFVFPCAFFDPVWQGISLEKVPFNDFGSFFKQFDHQFINKLDICSYRDFFPGCYTYHWHNQWGAEEYEDSFFGIFEKEFDQLLKLNSNLFYRG